MCGWLTWSAASHSEGGRSKGVTSVWTDMLEDLVVAHNLLGGVALAIELLLQGLEIP